MGPLEFVAQQIAHSPIRADRFLEELQRFEKEGGLPRLQILRLPNDHTSGTKVGMPTPTAFVADKFDAKTLAPSAAAAAGHVARHGGARLARFYEAVTPVLTPEQRTKLATHLRERLNDQHVASTK